VQIRYVSFGNNIMNYDPGKIDKIIKNILNLKLIVNYKDRPHYNYCVYDYVVKIYTWEFPTYFLSMNGSYSIRLGFSVTDLTTIRWLNQIFEHNHAIKLFTNELLDYDGKSISIKEIAKVIYHMYDIKRIKKLYLFT
jgi:hypothetical protein